MKKVFLFPGQGSQYVGMGKVLYKKSDFAKKTYNKACDILNYDIKEISFNDKNNLLNDTKYTQPAIFIYSIVLDYILKNNGIFPDAVAGHSLGEYSALVSNDTINFTQALLIIKKRANSMYLEGINNPGKMIAVIDDKKKLIEKLVNNEKNICIANFNSFNQYVISGKIENINNFIENAKSNGIRKIIPLKVSGAFHSKLMKATKDLLKKTITPINFNSNRIPIYQNYAPTKNLNSDDIKNNLIKQVNNAVRWEEIILNLYNDKYKYFIEVGPKNILTRLNKNIVPNSKYNFIEQMEYIQKYNV